MLVYALTSIVIFDGTAANTAVALVGIGAGDSFADVLMRIMLMPVLDEIEVTELPMQAERHLGLLADDVQFTLSGTPEQLARDGPPWHGPLSWA